MTDPDMIIFASLEIGQKEKRKTRESIFFLLGKFSNICNIKSTDWLKNLSVEKIKIKLRSQVFFLVGHNSSTSEDSSSVEHNFYSPTGNEKLYLQATFLASTAYRLKIP